MHHVDIYLYFISIHAHIDDSIRYSLLHTASATFTLSMSIFRLSPSTSPSITRMLTLTSATLTSNRPRPTMTMAPSVYTTINTMPTSAPASSMEKRQNSVSTAWPLHWPSSDITGHTWWHRNTPRLTPAHTARTHDKWHIHTLVTTGSIHASSLFLDVILWITLYQ